jgi:hypothetical protein
MDGLLLKAVLFDIFLQLFIVIFIIEGGSFLASLRPTLLLELTRGIFAMLFFDHFRYNCELCAVLLTLVSL